MTQITFVSNEVLAKMPNGDRQMLLIKLADPLVLQFIDKQIQFAHEVQADLDPESEKDPVKFHALASQWRLVWRFWTDFRALITDWASQVKINH